MVKDIVFHLGDPKTGTTSIQEALATRNWRCEGIDLLYSAPINHLPLAKSLYNVEDMPMRAMRWQELADAVAGSPADVAVVSAELFEHVDPRELARALDEFLPDLAASARLIVYVRPHADRLVSAYAERIKQGFATGTLAEVHENTKKSGHFLFAPRLRRWRAVFGDRLTVRPMIRDRLKDRDVVRDFLDYVFQGRPFALDREPASNESLTLEDLAMLREFHLKVKSRPALQKARRAIGWNFAQHLSGLPREGGTRPRLHRDLVPDVVATYRADAEAMDAEFFGGVPTLLPALLDAETRAVEAPQSIDAADHFSPDELRMIRVWVELVAQMLEHNPDMLPEYFRRRQREIFAAQRGDDVGPIEGARVRPGVGRRKGPGSREKLPGSDKLGKKTGQRGKRRANGKRRGAGKGSVE